MFWKVHGPYFSKIVLSWDNTRRFETTPDQMRQPSSQPGAWQHMTQTQDLRLRRFLAGRAVGAPFCSSRASASRLRLACWAPLWFVFFLLRFLGGRPDTNLGYHRLSAFVSKVVDLIWSGVVSSHRELSHGFIFRKIWIIHFVKHWKLSKSVKSPRNTNHSNTVAKPRSGRMSHWGLSHLVGCCLNSSGVVSRKYDFRKIWTMNFTEHKKISKSVQ